MQETRKWVEKQYMDMQTKKFISNFWFYFLNILFIFLTAAMIILNLYAIQKNPFNDTKILFVTISILTGFGALIGSISSFFTLRKNANVFKQKHDDIDSEYKDWKKNDGKYKNKNKDVVLINEILRITSEE